MQPKPIARTAGGYRPRPRMMRVVDGYYCQRCELPFQGAEPRCPKCLRLSSVVPAGAAGAKAIAAPAAAYVPPPSPARERRPGEGHVIANAVMQGILIGLHAVTIVSVVINIALSNTTADLGALNDVYRTTDDMELTVRYFTWGCMGIWSLIGMLWTPINTYGLVTRKPWARISTLVYWAGSLITICCFPL